MNQRTPLQLVELSGTPLEVAFNLGKIRAKKIHRRIEFWNQEISNLHRGTKKEVISLQKNFLKITKRQAPHYLEEIRGMAQGANVPFDDLFRLNLTELKAIADKCTTLILPLKTSHGRKILLAHNEDWDQKRNDLFLLKAHLPHVSYVILAYDGYLPGLSCGFNSFGLYHAINYLPAPDPRLGLPRIFITRHLVTARNFNDSLSWIKKNRRAFGQSIHLAQGALYLGIELTSQKIAFTNLKLPAVHTNHYLDKSIQQKSEASIVNSMGRLRTAKKLLEKECCHPQKLLSKRTAVSMAKKILSSKSGRLYPIWRNDARGTTLATAILSTDSTTLQVFRKRPVEGPSFCVKL